MGITHIIVGGYGHLGRRIADELCARGYEVVAIDREAGLHPDGEGRRLVIGDVCDEETLHEAGVETAHCLITVTGDDRTNLEAALAARNRAPNLRVIVRLFDQGLANSIEEAFGVQALSASFLALHACLAAATEDAVMAAFDIDGRQLNLARVGQRMPEEKVFVHIDGERLSISRSRADGEDGVYVTLSALGRPAAQQRTRRSSARPSVKRCLAACRPRKVADRLVAGWNHAALITRRLALTLLLVVTVSVVVFSTVGKMPVLDAMYFVVTTLTTVGYGDINLMTAPPILKAYGITMMLCGAALLAMLYAIFSDIVLTARIEYLLGRRAVALSDHIIIVGLGKVGYRVAKALHALGFPVVAVEAQEDSDKVSAMRLVIPVIIGNAARTSVLLKAGVERARTILALTDDPMLNLNVALQARQTNPCIRTVVRTYDSRFTERLSSFKLDATLSTSAISAPVFTNAAIFPGVEGSLVIDGQDILVVRYQVDAASPLHGLTADEIGRELGIALALTSRGNDSPYHLAREETMLSDGDVAVLLLTHDRFADLMDRA